MKPEPGQLGQDTTIFDNRETTMKILDKLFGPPDISKAQEKRDINGLIKALSYKEVNTRKAAIRALGDLMDRRAVEPLIGVLTDRYIDVRMEAATALGKLGDSAALTPLIVALNDEESWVAQEAALALAKLSDSRALDPLIGALRSTNRFLRQGAADGLGELGDRRAVRPLIAALEDSDEDVRCGAALALAKLGATEAVDSLVTMLKDRHEYVRRDAATALGRLGDPGALRPLIAARSDMNQIVRVTVEEAIDLIDPSGDKRKRVEVRSKSDSERISELRPFLSSHNWTEAVEAARTLGSIGSPEAGEALAAGLEGDAHGAIPTNTFRAIIRELSRLDREQLVQKLCDMYRKLPHLHAKKQHIIEALGELGGPQALSTIRLALLDKDATVVMHAREALKKLEHA